MKRSLLIVLSTLLFSSISIAQEYYTIIVGTFLDAKTSDFNEIRAFGLVYAYQMDGNLSKVFLGGFDEKSKADKVLVSIRQKGYSSAFVQERHLDEGRVVTVIQMATRNVNKTIDWERFEKNGQLYAILNGSKVKVLTGIYSDVSTAKQKLSVIHAAGYKDAFVKNVNSTLLVKISTFETGIKKALIPLSFDQKTVKGAPVRPKEPTTNRPNQYEKVTTKGGNRPSSYDTKVKAKGGFVQPVSTKKNGLALPAIRAKVKRRSALELQKVLKTEKYYKSSLDGYYGEGTANAYKQAVEHNSELRKYGLLAKYSTEAIPSKSRDRLQNAINRFLIDPSAMSTIEASKSPVALSYQAYYLFTKLGASSDVNRLMSNALRQAYEGKKLENKPPFDFKATYAYEGIEQLILHLFYVHAAPGNKYEIPCWMYEQHRREAAEAQNAVAGFGSEDFKSAVCAQSLNWEEIKLVKVIAQDLDANQASKVKLTTAAAKRSQIFLNPKHLTKTEIKDAETWNQLLWSNLNAWSNRDPLHSKTVDALKIAYYQSAVRLEDHFMDQGYTAKQSKGYALATLKTLVGEYLSRFV